MNVIRSALFGIGVAAISATSVVAQVSVSHDGKITGYTPQGPVSSLTAADRANAKSRLPMLTDLSQVPGMDQVAPQAYGTGNQPFTTKGAYANATTGNPTNTPPFRSTGKLWMQKGASTFVCTASVIETGVLVTAAHCVWDYGVGPVDSVWFEPARHGTVAPYNLRYGTWTAINWFVPSVYANGTDTCTVSGIVCENDIAVVVLNTGPAPHTGKNIAEVVGKYGYYVNNQGYIGFLGKSTTQITQLGYPAAFDSGYKMIRTDSLGYQAAPSNVLIGSDQTGGSSGGPWLQNFGTDPVSASSAPSFNARNRVVATTSWGYNSSSVKIQGASRFANNTAFPSPGPSNVKALIDFACAADPTKC